MTAIIERPAETVEFLARNTWAPMVRARITRICELLYSGEGHHHGGDESSAAACRASTAESMLYTASNAPYRRLLLAAGRW